MRTERRERTIVQEYTVYIANDGKEFEFEEECADYERRHDKTKNYCPNCNGTGKIKEEVLTEDYHDHMPYYKTVYHMCEKCKGKGYFDKV